MVDFKKMFMIGFTFNIVFFFIVGSVAILPGLNLVGVPFLIVFIGLANLIMGLICMFKCNFNPFKKS